MSTVGGQILPNNVLHQQNNIERKQAQWLNDLDNNDEKEGNGLLQFFDQFGIPKGPALRLANAIFQMKSMASECLLYEVILKQYNTKRENEIKKYKRAIKSITDAIKKEEAKSRLQSFMDNFWELPTCDSDENPPYIESWKKNKTSLEDKIKDIEKMPLKDIHKFMKSKKLQKDIDNILKTTQYMAAAQLLFCFQDAFQWHKKLKKSRQKAKLIRLKLQHIKRKYVDPVVNEFAKDNGYPNLNVNLITEGIDELKILKKDCEIQRNEATQSFISNIITAANMLILGYGSNYQSQTLGKIASKAVANRQNFATAAYVASSVIYGGMAINDLVKRQEWSKIINEIDKYLESLNNIKNCLQGRTPIRSL